MKVLFFSKKDKKDILKLLNKKVDVVEDNPEVVIVQGGDGTFMRSESEFPGVPKLLLKDSRICKLCSHLPNEEVIKKFLSNDYVEKEIMKIKAKVGNESVSGINDVIVHNKDPRHAIRYTVSVNGKRFIDEEVIGDGVVVATPLGSTGYYRSITDSFFQTGIGLAFNNSTEQSDHVVLKEDSIITIEIQRGPALVYADNNKKEIILNNGDKVSIVKSDETAKIIKVN
ncbi:MAG: hypothetical protein WDZ80_08100 [Candidatus Paceibacterota bacterium]